MAEQRSSEFIAMSGTLIWEPMFNDMLATDFEALTHRMLRRLDEQGWKLVRKDS